MEFSRLFLLKYDLLVSKDITASGTKWHLTSSGPGSAGEVGHHSHTLFLGTLTRTQSSLDVQTLGTHPRTTESKSGLLSDSNAHNI